MKRYIKVMKYHEGGEAVNLYSDGVRLTHAPVGSPYS